MRVSPVVKQRSPGYPTKHMADVHPELLCVVPERWRLNPVVMSALAGTAMLLSGTKTLAEDNSKPASETTDVPLVTQIQVIDTVQLMGDYDMPVILTEDEARRIVVDEAKRCGINFVITQKNIDVEIPAVREQKGKGDPKVGSRLSTSLELDGADSRHNIYYEVVTTADRNALASRSLEWKAAVEKTTTKEAADLLRKGLKPRNTKEHVLVAFDPAEYNKEISQKHLRKQVQDFIKWLKAEGII